ncbi:LacI family transcriptional regulator [Humibacter sp. BT305]|nr:LacI family transcriptional regulator [Humibacter sp. BT305]
MATTDRAEFPGEMTQTSPRPAARRPATLQDVARTAGVSPSTASNALTGRRRVSPEALDAVNEAVRLLRYRVNGSARSLRTGATATMGLIAPDVTDPFYAEMVQSIERDARDRGWSVILSDSGFDPEREAESLRHMAATTDGVILFSTDPRRAPLSELPADHVPVVACDEPIQAAGVGAVRSDNFGGGRLAAHHLVDAGGTRFAMIGGLGRLATSAERREGFLAGLRDRGVDSDRVLVVGREYGLDGGRAAMRELLDVAPDTDAVFAPTDGQAIGAMFHAQQSGRTIPDDLQLCGFDGIIWASHLSPALTTVEQDRRAMASRAIDLLLGMIAGEPAETVILPVRLLAQGSTRVGPRPA